MIVQDDTGATRSSNSFRVRSRTIDDDSVRAARELAYANGRVLERDGLAILAIGTAVRIAFPNGIAHDPQAISTFLSDVLDQSNLLTTAPIALAALPYDLNTYNEFIIAKITVFKRGTDPAVAIFFGAEEEIDSIVQRDLVAEALNIVDVAPGDSPDHFTLEAVIAHETFRHKVADAVSAIEKGHIEKVVLARELAITANRPFSQQDLLGRLRALHPSCLSFAIDGFFGATPELLLRKDGHRTTSIPLAGTIARSGDPEEDERHARDLMHSEKDRSEHQFVIDEICRILSSFADEIDVPSKPHILELRNVVHLATSIEAKLESQATTALEIATQLHPTPAICGVPRAAAQRYIADHEGFSRDHYAGLVGYIDAHGDGEWWIGIRSAIVDGNTARMFAGVGIVADSDPASELAETQLKLQAMLAVLVRP